MERTRAYYSAVLLVRRQRSEYTWGNVEVADNVTIAGRTVAFDLWTYFKAYRSDDKVLAAAYPCEFDAVTGRPIVGYFELNLIAVKASASNLILQMGTFVHEFYHILVFCDELFDRFIKSDGRLVGRENLIGNYAHPIKGEIRHAYKGEHVLNFARVFLNYPSLSGIVLENDGGNSSAGSHWEHMYWATDFMSPADTMPSLLSELSLSMALDSGWFEIDTRFVQPLEYGRGAGIEIQTEVCPTADIRGFCSSPGQSSCSPDYKSKATCYSDEKYSEGCYFKFADVVCSIDDDYGKMVDSKIEALGDSSRCVMTSIYFGPLKPLCAKAVCTGTSSVMYTFGNGKSCTCSSDENNVRCLAGAISVLCPDSIAEFCETMLDKYKCPSDCSSHGICLGNPGSKRCFCVYGWKGDDCNTPDNIESDTKVFIQQKQGAAVLIPFMILIQLIFIAY